MKRLYEIEIEGVKGYLKPLTFFVAEAAMSFRMSNPPKYITSGEVLITNLWEKGSSKLKKGGEFYIDACLQANNLLSGIRAAMDGNTIIVARLEPRQGKEAELVKYRCTLGEIDRETLEDCLGLIMPVMGRPQILTAGKKILTNCSTEMDDAILQDDELLIAACMKAYEKIETRKGKVTKQ